MPLDGFDLEDSPRHRTDDIELCQHHLRLLRLRGHRLHPLVRRPHVAVEVVPEGEADVGADVAAEPLPLGGGAMGPFTYDVYKLFGFCHPITAINV